MPEQKFKKGDRVVKGGYHGEIESYEPTYGGEMFYRVKWDPGSGKIDAFGWRDSLQPEPADYVRPGTPVDKSAALEAAGKAYARAALNVTRASDKTHAEVALFNAMIKRHEAERLALARKHEAEAEHTRALCQLADAGYLAAKKCMEDASKDLDRAVEASK